MVKDKGWSRQRRKREEREVKASKREERYRQMNDEWKAQEQRDRERRAAEDQMLDNVCIVMQGLADFFSGKSSIQIEHPTMRNLHVRYKPPQE